MTSLGLLGRFTLSKFKQPDRLSMTSPRLRGEDAASRSFPNIASFIRVSDSIFKQPKTISDPRRQSRRAMRPRFCVYLPPKEGVGNAGCPLHPRPRVHLVLVERTRVTTSTPESPGIPARNGFNGFLRALPGEPGLFATITCGYVLSKPGWADATPQT